MNKSAFRLVLAIAGVLLIVYGLFSGRLAASFKETPASTGFIVAVLVLYAAVNLRNAFRKKH